MLSRILKFIRGEAVLSIAFACACVSVAITGDVAHVPDYIDWRVIGLLFCLMAAISGLQASGVLGSVARRLVVGDHTRRSVCLALVLLPFFGSMVLTNDVALITFVPIATLALAAAGMRDLIVRVIVLQTIAANLGGMVTPFGNPQNLFIFTTYELSVSDFFFTLAPFGLLAFLIIVGACLVCGSQHTSVTLESGPGKVEPLRAAMYAALFLLGVLALMRVIPWQVLLLAVAPALFIFDREVFLHLDYGLLGTFVCFFVFSGNVAHMPALQGFLSAAMDAHPMITSLLASQVISNVPAAVLLAGFTGNWHSLLIGVDLGGLGTPIASLASLIALRLYLYEPDATTASFMRVFLAANVAVLAAMVGLYAVLFVL